LAQIQGTIAELHQFYRFWFHTAVSKA